MFYPCHKPYNRPSCKLCHKPLLKGGFMSWKIPSRIWMRTGGTPLLGTPPWKFSSRQSESPPSFPAKLGGTAKRKAYVSSSSWGSPQLAGWSLWTGTSHTKMDDLGLPPWRWKPTHGTLGLSYWCVSGREWLGCWGIGIIIHSYGLDPFPHSLLSTSKLWSSIPQ